MDNQNLQKCLETALNTEDIDSAVRIIVELRKGLAKIDLELVQNQIFDLKPQLSEIKARLRPADYAENQAPNKEANEDFFTHNNEVSDYKVYTKAINPKIYQVLQEYGFPEYICLKGASQCSSIEAALNLASELSLN